ncbi:MAG: ROK family protein, partial [archaeon]
MPLIECFDVGGTSIRAALIQDEKILIQKIIPSVNGSPEKLFSMIQGLSTELRNKSPNSTVDYTVIGLPGSIQDRTLLCSFPLNIASAVSLEPLFQFFPNPLRFENDMKLAVKAEYFRGQGNNLNSFYLLTFSTGIGAGLVWDKTILEGTMGEFGHMVVSTDANAPICALGHVGCWIAYSSGAGIQARAQNEMNQSLSTAD